MADYRLEVRFGRWRYSAAEITLYLHLERQNPKTIRYTPEAPMKHLEADSCSPTGVVTFD
jgi:hypothetical protein